VRHEKRIALKSARVLTIMLLTTQPMYALTVPSMSDQFLADVSCSVRMVSAPSRILQRERERTTGRVWLDEVAGEAIAFYQHKQGDHIVHTSGSSTTHPECCSLHPRSGEVKAEGDANACGNKSDRRGHSRCTAAHEPGAATIPPLPWMLMFCMK
jgi:hypothetical protein